MKEKSVIQLPIPQFVLRNIDRLIGVPKIRELDRRFRGSRSGDYFEDWIRYLQLDLKIDGEENLLSADRSKPWVIVANHPRGLADMFAVGRVLERHFGSENLRMIANSVIGLIFPSLSERLFSVEVISKHASAKLRNREAVLEASAWLGPGRVLIFFPAGTVSGLRWRKRERRFGVEDGDWHPTVLKIAKDRGASVLPVHISGRNTWLFLLIGLFGTNAKRLRLFKEFRLARGSGVLVKIGKPLGPEIAIEALREMVYELGERERDRT